MPQQRGGVDRLGALPDEALQHVLSFLPLQEAVQTSVLARRWRHLWKSMPILRITGEGRVLNQLGVVTRLNKFVNHLLLLRDRSTRLDACEIKLSTFQSQDNPQINLWIRDALLCQARVVQVHLSIDNNSFELEDMALISRHLTRLELCNVVLKNCFLNFSSCPALEELVMRSCHIEAGSILSESLKRLMAMDCVFPSYPRTRISLPRLVTLELSDLWGSTPVLESMSLLLTAFIKLTECDDHCGKEEFGGSCDSNACDNCGADGGSSGDSVVLGGLSEAKSLVLIAIPRVFIFRRDLTYCSRFGKLKTLLLNEWCVAIDLVALIYFLQYTPVLEKLTLQLCKAPINWMEKEGSYSPTENLFASKQLKVVEIKYEKFDMRVHKIIMFFSTYGLNIGQICIQRSVRDSEEPTNDFGAGPSRVPTTPFSPSENALLKSTINQVLGQQQELIAQQQQQILSQLQRRQQILHEITTQLCKYSAPPLPQRAQQTNFYPSGVANNERLELINPVLDRNHRSRMLSRGTFCNVLRTRGPDQYWKIDPRWIPRLRAAGLLTFARLVEPCRGGASRFPIDASLLSALVDRWRVETHTFHLTVGEMAPTLQDVTMLLGLPLVGHAVGPNVVDSGWANDMLASFAGVLDVPIMDMTNGHGPTKSWLDQFRQEQFDPNQEDWIVRRHLVAYLLWLFGWVMFTGTHADSVDKHFIQMAEEIAELPIEVIPKYSWGSAVLAATYAGLCDACTRNSRQSSLTGCPLLLMLWSYERIDIGRPQLDSYDSYDIEMYTSGVEDPDDRPTFGSLWAYRQLRWVSGTTRRAYRQFVADLDQLTPDRVRWTPYENQHLVQRAPHGLAQLCMRDSQWWKTTRHLVFDVHVEPYHVHRVMKQFAMYQPYPPPMGRFLEDNFHTYSRKGLGLNYEAIVVEKMAHMVTQWIDGSTDLLLDTPPDDGTTYAEYLRWYHSATRWRCFLLHDDTTPPHEATITDTFAPQPQSAYNAMVEFVEQVYHESDELITRLEMRPQVCSPHEVSNILRGFRSRAMALLRRVACRSVADVALLSSHQ